MGILWQDVMAALDIQKRFFEASPVLNNGTITFKGTRLRSMTYQGQMVSVIRVSTYNGIMNECFDDALAQARKDKRKGTTEGAPHFPVITE
jgi:hypothetical protein